MQAMETKKWEKENKAIESFDPARITLRRSEVGGGGGVESDQT